MAKQQPNIANLVNSSGCFDLQFRKDTRHERTNSPTYYRWKTQFIIAVPKEKTAVLKKVQRAFLCGKVHVSGDQARFSVQKIDDVVERLIPQLKKSSLQNAKKKDFELWQKAVAIIYNNKGKQLASWKKADLHSLLAIHQSSMKYKNNPRVPKWLETAKSFAKAV